MDSYSTILVTGGLGFIGSHTVTLLLEKGYRVIIIDNLYNSSIKVLEKIEMLTGFNTEQCIFLEIDITNKYELLASLRIYKDQIDTCIHFAGYKAVGESVTKPLLYYNNNIVGTINLLEVLDMLGCNKLVFSSSATVYGVPKTVPILETSDTGFLNPYGCTKLVIEEILESLAMSSIGSTKRTISLRYFNPIGAHPSGLLGEDPNDIPNNLLPFIMRVAHNPDDLEVYRQLKIYGSDYDTVDGTGVRDYIHVMDLAKAHVLAIENVLHNPNKYSKNYYSCNIGLGKGTSVLEMVAMTSALLGRELPYVFFPRRNGDCATVYADNTLCREMLGFSPDYTIKDAIRHSLNFIEKNSGKK